MTLNQYFPVVRAAPVASDVYAGLSADELASKQWTQAIPFFIRRTFDEARDKYPNINPMLFNIVYRVLCGGSKKVAQILAKKLSVTPKCRQVMSKITLNDLFSSIDRLAETHRDYGTVDAFADPDDANVQENISFTPFTVGATSYPFYFMIVCAASCWLHSGATLVGFHTQSDIPSTHTEIDKEDVKIRRVAFKSYLAEALATIDCVLLLSASLGLSWGTEGPPEEWDPSSQRFSTQERLQNCTAFLSRHAFTWLDGRGGEYKAKAGETSSGIRANAAQIKTNAAALTETQTDVRSLHDEVRSLQTAISVLQNELQILKERFDASQPVWPARPPTEPTVARARRSGLKNPREDNDDE